MPTTSVELEWRPIAGGDVAAWAALLAAAEAVDATGEHYDADDLAEELADPALDAALDTVAAFDGDRMIAYGLVRGVGVVQHRLRVQVEGCVHPDHRRTGIGSAVLRRTVARAGEVHRQLHPDQPADLLLYAHAGNTGVAALAAAAGLQPARYWYDMHLDLAAPPPAAPVPDGLRLVGYHPGLDEALRLARNEAFADHWGTVQRDESSWRQWFTGNRAFRPALSLAALDGDEVAGLLLSYEYEADAAATGVRQAWIGHVGTRAPWRGRGLASAMIARALTGYRDAGYQRAALTVDTGNATGALGLYERCGFTVSERWVTFARPL